MKYTHIIISKARTQEHYTLNSTHLNLGGRLVMA